MQVKSSQDSKLSSSGRRNKRKTLEPKKLLQPKAEAEDQKLSRSLKRSLNQSEKTGDVRELQVSMDYYSNCWIKMTGFVILHVWPSIISGSLDAISFNQGPLIILYETPNPIKNEGNAINSSRLVPNVHALVALAAVAKTMPRPNAQPAAPTAQQQASKASPGHHRHWRSTPLLTWRPTLIR